MAVQDRTAALFPTFTRAAAVAHRDVTSRYLAVWCIAVAGFAVLSAAVTVGASSWRYLGDAGPHDAAAAAVDRLAAAPTAPGSPLTPPASTPPASKLAVRAYFDSLPPAPHGTGVEAAVICPGYVPPEIPRAARGASRAPKGKTSEAIEAGLSPERVAKAIVAAIESGRAELVIGGKETAGVYLARFAPGLVRRLAPRLKPD